MDITGLNQDDTTIVYDITQRKSSKEYPTPWPYIIWSSIFLAITLIGICVYFCLRRRVNLSNGIINTRHGQRDSHDSSGKIPSARTVIGSWNPRKKSITKSKSLEKSESVTFHPSPHKKLAKRNGHKLSKTSVPPEVHKSKNLHKQLKTHKIRSNNKQLRRGPRHGKEPYSPGLTQQFLSKLSTKKPQKTPSIVSDSDSLKQSFTSSGISIISKPEPSYLSINSKSNSYRDQESQSKNRSILSSGGKAVKKKGGRHIRY